MTAAVSAVAEAVAAVVDPEIPVLTIADLGILREVSEEGGRAVVTITPTYSGCPAVEAIRDDVVAAARAAGAQEVEVRVVLAPAWTTDWMSDGGRAKLAAYGIAPPQPRTGAEPVLLELGLRCPQCGSTRTRLLRRFAATSCQAAYSCDDCLEPFDHFKAH